MADIGGIDIAAMDDDAIERGDAGLAAGIVTCTGRATPGRSRQRVAAEWWLSELWRAGQ